MTGFWAGSVPAWAYVVGVLVCAAALCTGMWAGYGRGWEHCEEDQRWAREQAKARRVHPVYREPAPASASHGMWQHHADIARAYRQAGLTVPPEVAHDWGAHVEQALAVADDQPEIYPPEDSRHDWDPSCRQRGCPVHGNWDQPAEPDPLTDSQWMAEHVGDLHEFMDQLLNQHPAVEELP